MNMLKVLGGHSAVVEFQGGGDSGEIHNAVLYDQNNKEIDCSGITIDWTKRIALHDPLRQEWVERDETMPTPVLDVLRDMAETMLENEGLDWYNNDGGQGSLNIDLTQSPPTITLNVGINYTHTEEHEFDYTDFDDETEDEGTVTSEEGK